jgi:predicted RNase H-like HicB family nuclease
MDYTDGEKSCAIKEGRLYVKRRFTASISQEGEWYVAQCLEVDGQGATEDEALTNLREALELYFEAPMPTIKPDLRAIEVETDVA